MFNQSFGHPSLLNMGETISLVSLDIFKTRDYHDQWRRSYTCQLTGATLNNLGELVSSMGADKAFTMAGIAQLNNMGSNNGLDAGGLIRYSASPTAQVSIAGGWQQQRARFVLVVDVSKNGALIRREELVGYADHYGVSNLSGQAHLDPNMVFTIDSIKTEPYEMTRGISGMGTHTNIGTTQLILSNNNPISNPFDRSGSATQYTMRPIDIFTISDAQEILAGATEQMAGFQTQSGLVNIGGQDYISDAVLGTAAKTSNRKNDLPGSFASRVMTNFYQTSALATTAAGDDFMTPSSAAMLRTKETPVSDSSFAFAVRNVGGTCSQTGQFTHSELLRMDPTIDSRTLVHNQGELGGTLAGSGIYIPPTSHTEQAFKTSHHAIIAQMVSNAFLSLMSTHGISVCTAINDNYTGQARCTMTSQVGLNEQNREVMVNSFENAMAMEVLGIVASSGIGSFRIDVTADSANQVFVEVCLNGELQKTPFVFPAWAAASNSPIVTNNFDMISGFAGSVSDVVESVLGQRMPGNVNYNVPGVAGNNGVGGFGFSSGGSGTPNW